MALYLELYESLKRQIISGDYETDDKLPSKRQLEKHLNLSQTTIERAYELLLDEGFIYSKPRSGYYVSKLEVLPVVRKEIEEVSIQKDKKTYDYEFKTAQIDVEHFPFDMFRKLSRQVFDESFETLVNEDSKQGLFALRQQIATYLFNSRGVNASHDQIIIGSSTNQLIEHVVQILKKQKFMIEAPSYPPARDVLEKYNIDYIKIPLESDGICMESVKKSNHDVIFITPSHHFPTGTVLTIEKRTRLLKWAYEKNNRYIIEDDYDSEFRYFKKPLPALQSLDTENRVIYISTFSKALFPSLRMAYMVLPKELLQDFHQLKYIESNTVPIHMQQIMALFLRSGHFDRHLNKMRHIYKKKISYIIKRLKPYQDELTISGEQAGMHFVLTVNNDLTLEECLMRARQNSLKIEPMYTYNKEHKEVSFVIGFGGIKFNELKKHMDVLIDTLTM